MLLSIHIENVALIKELDLDFAKGFTALTGETGAGKSILVDSINMITGRRTSREVIRTGEESCFVSATFAQIDKKTLKRLAELGFDCEDGSVMLSKTLSLDGRSVSKINARTVPQAVLKSVSAVLININGQNDFYSLFDSANHLEYLDSYAYDNIEGFSGVMREYLDEYRRYAEAKARLEELSEKEKDRNTRIDFLRYQAGEIDGANIKIGEEESLSSQKAILLNREKISSSVKGAYHALMGASNRTAAYDRVVFATEQIDMIKEIDSRLASVCERLNELSYDIEALSEELAGLDGEDGGNPQVLLDQIEARLDTIYRTTKKYGMRDGELLAYLERIREEIAALEEYDDTLKRCAAEYESCRELCVNAALRLNEKRSAAGERLERLIEEELVFLDMEKVRFQAVLLPMSEPNESGCGAFGFYVSTNTGEPPKPIESVASGGELSRIILALKTVLAKSYDVGTVIFDEIDTGLSGKTSRKIGITLKRLSARRQVISVTHSAQVASAADSHYKIVKEETDGRTVTQVIPLKREERILEIARILGGVIITDAVKESARELLDEKLM